MPAHSLQKVSGFKVPALPLRVTLLLAFVVQLCLLPVIFHPYDIFTCWIPWAKLSGGQTPWDIYRHSTTCDYPVIWLYLLTALERLRLLFGWAPDSMNTIYLFKLPGMLAHLAGIPLVYYGLRRAIPGNGRQARRAALLYAFCPALLVNGVLWGQIDTLLVLGMLGAVLSLMNRRAAWAGAWLGGALSVKLQAIIIVPVLLVYVFRKRGPQPVMTFLAATLGVVSLLAAPFWMAGTGAHWWNNYSSAVGRYPKRSLNAFNAWAIINTLDMSATQRPEVVVNRDDQPSVAGITPRHIGLALFGVVLLAVLARLWRRPTANLLVESATLSVLAFFLLCTQMHERYGVPAAALLTLVAVISPMSLWRWLMLGATLGWNQMTVLIFDYDIVMRQPPQFIYAVWQPSLVIVSVVNLLILASFLWSGPLVTPVEKKK